MYFQTITPEFLTLQQSNFEDRKPHPSSISVALFSAAELEAPLHCKLNFQVVSGIQLSDTKSGTKIVKSKIMALGLTESTTSIQLLKSAPLICVTH